MLKDAETDGWPLVLRGTEYVGSSDDGVRVFRPVESMLSSEFPVPAGGWPSLVPS